MTTESNTALTRSEERLQRLPYIKSVETETHAVAGAAIGGPSNRVGGAAIGAVAGGLLGNVIGRDMDERDRQLAEAAQLQALEYGRSGSPTPWDNPESQHRGQIVPGKPYVQNGLNCRPYTHTIYISGQPQTARGTACRQPDGSWRTVG